MKIAITGHTSGLGKYLYDNFEDTIGFSRSNGYDIKNYKDIVKELDEVDVFINNAHSGFYQVELLYCLFDKWKYIPNKSIINISSNASDGIMYFEQKYAIEKSALDSACDQLAYNQTSLCKIYCVKPGYIDTERVKGVIAPKIKVEDIFSLLNSIIFSKNSYYPYKITVLPNK